MANTTTDSSSSLPPAKHGVRNLKPRNRVVVFRLTEEEYNCIKSACDSSGGRNFSDYTRSGLLSIAQVSSSPASLEKRFVEISHKLADVQELLNRLLDLFTSTAGQNEKTERVEPNGKG